MAIYQVIYVISMRHALMAAVWPVFMFGAMSTAIMFGRACVRVFASGGDLMVIDMIAVYVV